MPFANFKVPAGTLTEEQKEQIITRTTELYVDLYGERARAATLVLVEEVPDGGWGIGGNVNFATLGAPGLTAAAIYASGHRRVNAATGAPIPDRNETNVRADYAFPKGTVLEGLVATLRYSWLHQDGSPQTAPQFRAHINYDVRF